MHSKALLAGNKLCIALAHLYKVSLELYTILNILELYTILDIYTYSNSYKKRSNFLYK